MLLRVYRLTDKLGLAVIKSGVMFSDWMLEGAATLLGTNAEEGSAGILGLLKAILSLLVMFVVGIGLVLQVIARAIFAILKRVGSFIWQVLVFMGGLLRRLGRGIFAVLAIGGRFLQRGTAATTRSTSSLGGAAAGSVGRSMARRKARAEMEVGVVEDPLRIQNRILSVIVVVAIAGLIGVLLWATDPSRNGGVGVAVIPAGDDAVALLSGDPTIEPTSIAGAIGGTEPTPIPTATQIPVALQSLGTIAYVVRENGQQDIWAVEIGSHTPIRLTNHPADERDPAWSPDGSQLAYASRQNGNWDIYVYNLERDETIQMTLDLSFQGSPQWSPDGRWLMYESYQGQNLDIYAIPVDGSQPAQRITSHETPDFSPAWSPTNDGDSIAFVSWRDGNQDIYIFNLRSREITNLTNTPNRNEDHPAWSADGRYISYSALDQGQEKIFVKAVAAPEATPRVLSFGRTPTWSPEGLNLAFTVPSNNGELSYLYAVPFEESGVATGVIDLPPGSSDPAWTSQVLPRSLVNGGGKALAVSDLYIEQSQSFESGAPYRLRTLLNVQAPSPVLSDRVNDSFDALRAETLERVGWDFLGQLDDAFWEDLNRLPAPGEPRRNWYMAGRAFSITQSSIRGFPPPIEIVREDIGVETYWRVYVRVADEAQNGQLGEPLRTMPWDLLSADQADVTAYDQGGRLRSAFPSGYYVDFTQLAEDYGWSRVPARTDWRSNRSGMNYWLFEKRNGLTWEDAMLEIYTRDQLGGLLPTPTPAVRATEQTGS